MTTKALLLNKIDRKLLMAEGQLMHQQVQVAQRMVTKARASFDEAIKDIVLSKPMRDRPPEKAQLKYDEAQGALVWDADEPLPALPPAAEPVTAEV